MERSKKNKLAIIGAGGHGRVVADIAKLNGYQEIIFFDDDAKLKRIGKYPVIGSSLEAVSYKNSYDIFIAIGNNKIREQVTIQLQKNDITSPVLVHPSAVIDKTTSLGAGTVVMANAVVNANATIKEGCIINTAATVDHDCILEKFVHISPGAHLAGTVHIGTRTWLGIGSIVINNIDICKDCLIAAGATVCQNLSKSGVYTGTPCRLNI